MDEIKYLSDIYNFHLYYVESIGSTNTFLKENYSSYPNKSILLANRQTNGRGRYTRVWQSNDDYTFSILLKDKYRNEIIAPLAIVRGLKKYGLDTFIKWPNDIYYQNKKLSGILIETVYLGSDYIATIIGIGINKSDKPDVNGIGINKDISNIDLVTSIMKEYDRLLNEDFKEYIKEYKSYSNVLDKVIEYQGNDYIAKDITEEGHLIIERNGILKEISTDEINLKINVL